MNKLGACTIVATSLLGQTRTLGTEYAVRPERAMVHAIVQAMARGLIPTWPAGVGP